MTTHAPNPALLPDTYLRPSPFIPTIDNGAHFVNPEYQDEEPRHLRPEGESHARGTCGGYAGLCGECWDLELAWHLKIMRRIVAKYPPRPAENIADYACRVRVRMVDTWHDALSKALREAKP